MTTTKGKEEDTAVGDAYARCRTGSAAGRGSVDGWTPCPLCSSLQSSNFIRLNGTYNGTYNLSDDCISKIMSNIPKSAKSVKLFSHGRGLAAHLHAVHTPWKPGKAELKRRKALQKRMENEQRKIQRLCSKKGGGSNNGRIDDGEERCRKRLKVGHNGSGSGINQQNTRKETYEPTEEEIMHWNQRVMEIVTLVESEAKKLENTTRCTDERNIDAHKSNTVEDTVEETCPQQGRDRSGNVFLSYRKSLHPFLAAAANGDLQAMQKCIGVNLENLSYTIHADENVESRPLDPKRDDHVNSLLSLRDRNGSTAEHWAAGGGHLDCVSYLLELRDAIVKESFDKLVKTLNTEPPKTILPNKKIRRRRDGKTSLHYAARNGHNDVIDLLLHRHDASPNIPSGDGTTPLHMACYGGHPSTVKHLVETHNADAFALNEWECGASHWAAMSLATKGEDKVIELCEYLKKCGVDFAVRQKQGHAPLHKAASRKNRHVIEWLAKSTTFSEEERKLMGLPDTGGNKASDIWLSVGGEKEFGSWLNDACDW